MKSSEELCLAKEESTISTREEEITLECQYGAKRTKFYLKMFSYALDHILTTLPNSHAADEMFGLPNFGANDI